MPSFSVFVPQSRAVCGGLLSLAIGLTSAVSVSFAEPPAAADAPSTLNSLAVTQQRFGDWVVTIIPGEHVPPTTVSYPAPLGSVSFQGVVPTRDFELAPEIIIPARGESAEKTEFPLITLLGAAEEGTADSENPIAPDSLPVIIPDAPTTATTESLATTETTDIPETAPTTEPTTQIEPSAEAAAIPCIASQSDPLALAEMYRQTYDAISFNRVEYDANPSYRHELAMELMFGQFRPSPVIRNQVTVSPTLSGPVYYGLGAGWPHVPYSPYRTYQRDRYGWTVRPYHFSGTPLAGHGTIWGPGW